MLGLFSYLLPAHTSLFLRLVDPSCHVLDPDFVASLHQRQRYLQNLRLAGGRVQTIVRMQSSRYLLKDNYLYHLVA